MSLETFAQRHRARPGPALFSLYARWAAWYLLIVAGLWWVGIEAIYEHPTPFYALVSPVFSSIAPFLLLAGLFSHASRIVAGLAPYLRVVSIIGGAILVVLGLWLVFGHTFLTNWFFALFHYLDVEDALIRFL